MIGANGSGKSSLFKTISGILKAKEGEIIYMGETITNRSPHEIIARGLIQVPEEGGTFPNLSIYENLIISCQRPEAKIVRQESLDYIYELFPPLFAKRNDLASSLSGGQRRMLSVSKAIMGKPEILLLDDISMGLAPKLIGELYEALNELTTRLDIAVLIVEQMVDIALGFASRGYVMSQGEILLEGSSSELSGIEEVKKLYIGN